MLGNVSDAQLRLAKRATAVGLCPTWRVEPNKAPVVNFSIIDLDETRLAQIVSVFEQAGVRLPPLSKEEYARLHPRRVKRARDGSR